MPVRQLEASIRWLGGVPVVDLQGDIDAPAEGVLEAAYKSLAGEGAPLIVLNFRDVDFINSKGIALIVEFLKRTLRANQRLLAYGLSDHFQRIFEITRLSDYIAIYDDERSALSAAESAEVARLASTA
jgi:anti-sigma B factor antagonist